MKSMNLSEVRANFCALAEEISRSGEEIVVSKFGRPLLKLVPIAPMDNHGDTPVVAESPTVYDAAWNTSETTSSGDYWGFSDAKGRFSELILQAMKNRPQFILRHGTPEAVVLSFEAFQSRMESTPRPDFSRFCGILSDEGAEALHRSVASQRKVDERDWQ